MNTRTAIRTATRVTVLFACVSILAGCHWDMWNDARYKPLEGSEFFGEGQSSSRMLVAGTVPYKKPGLDTHLTQGKVDGELATTFPDGIELNRELLERGRERFNIFCIVCHGPAGHANGMIVQRGFPEPPSYHIDRLRQVPIGYFVDVMTNGFGRMFSYATRIPPEDRWAIAAYVRALQLSQGATPDQLPANVLEHAKNPPVAVADTQEGQGEEH